MLSFVSSEENHVDEGDENGGRAPFRQPEVGGVGVCVVLGPLDEHQQSQIAKQTTEEEDLGDELRVDVDGLPGKC